MQGFRYQPTTAPDDRVVPRPRLTTLLNGRFSHRLTVMCGPAGSGKTTALALALHNNSLDPAGRDVWLGAGRNDDQPQHLAAGLARALGIDAGGEDDAVRRVIDAIWSAAPEDVVLVVDDAHVIDSEESLQVLRDLLEEMPANGHLLLASRHVPDIPMARLRALGHLLEITEADLQLDDDELAELRRRRHDTQIADLPRHAATADLQLVAGRAASADFLWEEILAGLNEERLDDLKRCAIVDELDDELVAELTAGRFDASTLVVGLPLVESHPDGGHRMHHLLREALTSRSTPGERRKAAAVAADVERGRERHHVAVQLYALAGDPISVSETAREFVLMPILKQTLEAILIIRREVAHSDPASAVAAALDASIHFGGHEELTVVHFERCAELARLRGDDRLEALAIHRIAQSKWIALSSVESDRLDRLTELAEVDDYAKGVLAHARSSLAQWEGDVDTALAAVDGYRYFGPATELAMRAERMSDLARPELAAIGLSPADLASLPPGAEIFIAFAMWLRGDASPEVAEQLVSAMIPSVVRRGFSHPTVSILGVGAVIAVAAGDMDTARRRALYAREVSDGCVGSTVELFVHVAFAAIAAAGECDAAAASILDSANTRVPFHRWPMRAHLLALTLLYVTRPETRDALDRCDLGPTMSVATNAGRAIVALREDRPEGFEMASRLPWHDAQALRALVLPHHLAELAVAAHHAGNQAAREVLDVLPHHGALLRRVEAESGDRVRGLVRQELDGRPERPTYTIAARMLGPVTLLRDGSPVDHPDWIRRRRVRDLFALLVERRRVHRFDALALLWPDHDDEQKALRNLRTTLSILNRVLEPDRASDADTYFVVNDHEHLELHQSVTTDVASFDQLVASAQSDDDAGLPGRALESYIAALAMYEGDYVDDVDLAWPVFTRLRLRSLAVGTACRVAELLAARGEPEASARYAERAMQIDADSERAARLLAAALEAGGDRSAARAVLTELLAGMRRRGDEPSPATRRLLGRLGLSD